MISLYLHLIYLLYLYGVEAMFNLSPVEVMSLSRADSMFIKDTLNLDRNTHDWLVFLEMGLEPIKVKIAKNRALFLKYMLDHPDDL